MSDTQTAPGISVGGNFQASAVANGNGTAVNIGGLVAFIVQVRGVTTATINFEGTTDSTNWNAIQALRMSTGAIATTTTANDLYLVPVQGLAQLRARISGYSAGTITIDGRGISSGAGLALASLSSGGGVQRISAGGPATGQTLKSFTGKPATSTTATTTINLYTVATGKTFFLSDLFVYTDQGSPMDIQVQAAGANIFRGLASSTAPIQAPGMESQPTAAGTQVLSLLLPITGVVQNVYYTVSGWES